MLLCSEESLFFLVLDGTTCNRTNLSVTHTRTYYCAKTTDDASPEGEPDDKNGGVRVSASAKKAFFFPGQGAQSVGMAKELCDTSPEAKKMFDVAADILGYDLLDVCANGPEERLNSTEVSQPAIYVSSMAALEKMKSTPEGKADIDAVDVCAGLSLANTPRWPLPARFPLKMD